MFYNLGSCKAFLMRQWCWNVKVLLVVGPLGPGAAILSVLLSNMSLGWRSLICSSRGCGSHLCLCSLWGYGGGLATGRMTRFLGLGGLSRSWWNRVQRMVVELIQPGGRSLSCLLAAGGCTRAMKFYQSWEPDPTIPFYK